jgi:hypothetical protein
VNSIGSSPSVFPNGDTFPATAAEGIRYTLDGMDSDTLSRLETPSGPLVMIPYPAPTVDMGQYLQRAKEPIDLERLWIDYVTELANEAAADPGREATVVAIGIHPFIVGTPSGTAALRRVIQTFRQQPLVWLTDVAAVYEICADAASTSRISGLGQVWRSLAHHASAELLTPLSRPPLPQVTARELAGKPRVQAQPRTDPIMFQDGAVPGALLEHNIHGRRSE